MTELAPHNAGVILLLAGRCAGERRDLAGIITECDRHGADKDVVCAVFGFFRSAKEPSAYRDFFRDSELDPLITNDEVATAFNLAMTALFKDADAKRIVGKRIVAKLRTLSGVSAPARRVPPLADPTRPTALRKKNPV
jgi:hypothetical protein